MPNPRYCPIPMPDGSDCWRKPHPDSKHRLCAVHWAEVASSWTMAQAYQGNDDEPARISRARCPKCRQFTIMRSSPDDAPFQCPNPRCAFDGARVRQPTRDDIAAERFQNSTNSGIVYYIAFGDRIKIGTTTDLDARLDALPHDEMLAYELGGMKRERGRHKQFAHALVPGQREWFFRAPDLMEHVANLAEGVADPRTDAKMAYRALRWERLGS